MTIVSLIPARGGSKGIRQKNLVHVGGLPLVVRTAFQSMSSKRIGRTMVSTEDSEIERVCIDYGIDVIRRPGKLATDRASTESVINHMIHVLEGEMEYPDILVLLQCTSPLRTGLDIDNAIDLLVFNGYDSVFSVTEVFYFLWTMVNGELVPKEKKYYLNRPRRQEMEKEYAENGAIYVFRTEGFKQWNNRIFGKKGMYLMPKERSVEIDDLFDLWVCRHLVKESENDEKGECEK